MNGFHNFHAFAANCVYDRHCINMLHMCVKGMSGGRQGIITGHNGRTCFAQFYNCMHVYILAISFKMWGH